MHKCNNGGTAHLAKPKNLANYDGNKVQKNIESRMVIVKAIVTKPIRFERDTPDHFQNVSAISRKTTWKQGKKSDRPDNHKGTRDAAKQN